MSKILTVFGATGNQGGSIIRAVLDDPALSAEFKIRGITRDRSKPAAKALLSKGVEADLDSKASVLEAIKGSHTVFLVTTLNFLAPEESPELAHGKNVADAAKELGVQHLIYSSLLHVSDITHGRLTHVVHFDKKAEVERYIRSTGVPSTFILPGYFMSNFSVFQMLQKGADGVYSLYNPVNEQAEFPLIDIEADMGKYGIAAIKKRSEVLGKQILAAADYYTPTRIVSEFQDITGNKARFISVDTESYKNSLPAPMADEMMENHWFIEDPGYFAGRSLKESLDLLASVGLKPTTWKDYLTNNKGLF
ncbi:hypothetical protein NM208_g3900 [Fusarium decemcellulare]|uniref:Uncharacterized protein n=1 Tax=Fusarium decemcellulare TaxID=57161 RepID=A0ACC1SMJ4_9HYPO|nr:hypothetical protein NM208_g3900 [Fusarium decemcellulare]